jgi:hypothetical protein
MYGIPQNTFLNQALQALGLDPETASYAEMILGLGSAGVAANAVTKSFAQASAASQAAKRETGGTNTGAPRFVTLDGGVTIDRMAVNATVSMQRQGRHVLGAQQYQGGSYFTSADDAQSVLNAFRSGSAEILGMKGSDIVVRVPGVTGFNVNPGSGFPNQATNVFFIKGTSSPSVVPHNPAWKP